MAVVCLVIVAGCALDKPGNVYNRIGGHSGQLIEPKRCLLKVAIVSRPFDDPTINEVVWRVADEQVISPEHRTGMGSQWPASRPDLGELPTGARSDPQGNRLLRRRSIRPTFYFESGEPTLISISPPVEQASLILNRDNRIFGKDYRGRQRLLPRDPAARRGQHVSLRLVPEIHHGPIQRHVSGVPNAAAAPAAGVQDQQRPARGNHPRAGHELWCSSRARSPSSAAVPSTSAAWAASCSLSPWPTATSGSRN